MIGSRPTLGGGTGRPAHARRVDSYRRAGLVTDMGVPAALARSADRWPTRPAIVDLCSGAPRIHSYADVARAVGQMASFLRAGGVCAGDVVLVQAPNSASVLVTCWAAWHVGAVCNPVVDIYREHEMRQIMEAARPVAIASVEEHRGHRHLAMFDRLASEVELEVRCRIALEGEAPGWTPYERVLRDAPGPWDPAPTDPDRPSLLLFTSGTTATPKGVLHSNRTLVAEARQLAYAWSFGWMDRIFLPLPVAHVTGVDFALTIPPVTGGCVVLSRMTGLEQAAHEVLEHGVTVMAATTAIIPHLARLGESRARDQLKVFVSGGTTISPALLDPAEAMGLAPARIYGMTELPTVTAPAPCDPRRQRLETDGRLGPGVECEAVDPETRELLPTEEQGELRVRGPELMLGYLDPDHTAAAVDADGWFYTGDLGRVDAQGCVSVTGRIKDIINRGGEKFSAREIEDLLVAHPAVAAAAVVGKRDRRFGEVPAAFLVCEPGATPPTGVELERLLTEVGVARQKVPVDWRWVDEMPLTQSNKVKKFELVARLDADPATQDE